MKKELKELLSIGLIVVVGFAIAFGATWVTIRQMNHTEVDEVEAGLIHEYIIEELGETVGGVWLRRNCSDRVFLSSKREARGCVRDDFKLVEDEVGYEHWLKQ